MLGRRRRLRAEDKSAGCYQGEQQQLCWHVTCCCMPATSRRAWTNASRQCNGSKCINREVKHMEYSNKNTSGEVKMQGLLLSKAQQPFMEVVATLGTEKSFTIEERTRSDNASSRMRGILHYQFHILHGMWMTQTATWKMHPDLERNYCSSMCVCTALVLHNMF